MNGKTHRAVGAGVGLGATIGFRMAERKHVQVAELAGAAVGGVLGASLPDIFEPARSSYHRKFCHSTTFTGGAIYGATQTLADMRQYLDSKADALWLKAKESQHFLAWLIFTLGALATDFLTGAITAIVPGYASHIVLDACTPRGVPII